MTYNWVEEQHEQPHVSHAPDFDPVDPQGALTMYTTCAHCARTAHTCAVCLCNAVQVFIRSEDEQTATAGTTLTTEYDVFGCGSFEMDQGKWLRLMPDAEVLPT